MVLQPPYTFILIIQAYLCGWLAVAPASGSAWWARGGAGSGSADGIAGCKGSTLGSKGAAIAPAIFTGLRSFLSELGTYAPCL